MLLPGDDISDFELIRRMAEQNTNFAGAREAWKVFYVRHQQFLLGVCRYKHGYSLSLEGINDLVQDAFVKAFDGAPTFDHAECCETAVQQLKCRGWLSRIAHNLVKDRYNGQPLICMMDDDEMERLPGAASASPDDVQVEVPENERLKFLKAGFDLLSDIEQTVLRATMFWWQADQPHQRMPQAAMEELSQQIGKSSDAIRQIRLRALNKLEKYVNENFQK